MRVAQQTLSKISWRIIAVVCCLQILSVAIGLRWFLTHTNILANNPNWIVSKNALFFPGYDGSTFTNYPPAVAENALNLAAWRGYHEVLSQNLLDWRQLSFKLQPTDHGYLYVIFDRSEETFNALRLSFTPLYRSALIRAKYTGEFISQEPLPPLPFNEKRWQELTLKRSATNANEYGLWINDTFVENFTTHRSATRSATQIGFRGGQKPVFIDSIRVFNQDKKLLLAENFDHQENFWAYFCFASVAILAINRIVFLLLQDQPALTKTYFQFLFVMSFFLICMASLGLTAEKPLRDRYPDFGHWWFRFLQGPTNSANVYLGNKIESIFENYSVEKPSNTRRVIILGSSQVDGEGTIRQGEDMSSQLQKILDQKLTSPTKKWEVIATGVSGQIASELLESFRYQWLKLQPDIVIVNLSSNDSVYTHGEVSPTFKQALEEFVALSKKHHFVLVFSAEANSIESIATIKTHQVMREVAVQNQIRFLDTHTYIASKTDTGILWWDFVHMTSFGYHLVSEYFFNQLEPVLRKL